TCPSFRYLCPQSKQHDMHTRYYLGALAALLLLALSACQPSAPTMPAETILYNGRFYTVDAAQPWPRP
ncbi:hypothetical protein RZS08_24070, partial [Arthrospira platensis SPKY1]|nr:hypothetical protein [Arthrospira platensis SPKY1]